MTRALNEAWKEAQSGGFALAEHSVVRAAMAGKIIEAVEAGETDAARLKRAALAVLESDWRNALRHD